MDKERTFEEVVRSIEMSENDVDRILKAARLTRNEKPKMSDNQLETIVGFATIVLIAVFMFGFMALTVILG